MAFDIYTVFKLYYLKIKIERQSLTGGVAKTLLGVKSLARIGGSVAEVNFSRLASAVKRNEYSEGVEK